MFKARFKDAFICLLIAQLFKKQCVNLKVLMAYAFNVPITNSKRFYDTHIWLWNYLRTMAFLSKWHELILLLKSFIKIEEKHLKYTLRTCHGFQQYFGCCFRTLVVFLHWLNENGTNENGINENVGFGCEYYWNINTISYHKYLCLKHLIHIKPHLRLFNDQEEKKQNNIGIINGCSTLIQFFR